MTYRAAYLSEGEWRLIYEKFGRQWFLRDKQGRVLRFDSEAAALDFLEG